MDRFLLFLIRVGRSERSRCLLRVVHTFTARTNGHDAIRVDRLRAGTVIDERALFVVGPHVAALRESERAVWARVGFGTRVIIEMRLEMMLLGECLGAQVALIGFQAGVQSGVQRHVGSVGKGLVTHLTLIGSLAAVRS